MLDGLLTRVIFRRSLGEINIAKVGERHYVDGLVILKLCSTGFRAVLVVVVAFRVEGEVKVGVSLRLGRVESEREV